MNDDAGGIDDAARLRPDQAQRQGPGAPLDPLANFQDIPEGNTFDQLSARLGDRTPGPDTRCPDRDFRPTVSELAGQAIHARQLAAGVRVDVGTRIHQLWSQ